MNDAMANRGLIAAYEATRFVVLTAPSRVFVVGEPASGVSPWLASQRATRAVIITAWNPFSRQTSEAMNIARQDELRLTLHKQGLRWLPAEGRDPSDVWRPEPSFCVFDPSDSLVDAWLKVFEQNATVLLDETSGCSLVWHPTCR